MTSSRPSAGRRKPSIWKHRNFPPAPTSSRCENGRILASPDEASQLRLRAADALGLRGDTAATQALAAALDVAGPPLLRRRCLTALAAQLASDDPAPRAHIAEALSYRAETLRNERVAA